MPCVLHQTCRFSAVTNVSNSIVSRRRLVRRRRSQRGDGTALGALEFEIIINAQVNRDGHIILIKPDLRDAPRMRKQC